MKAYVQTTYTDSEGTHEIGDEVDLPHTTEEEKQAFDRLVATGVITTRKADLPDLPDRKT